MSYSGDTRTIYVPAYLGAENQSHSRRRHSDIYSTSIHGTIYYTPRNPLDPDALAASPPSFPIPQIRPRQRRPHSIHIVSYPPGYIPAELRPRPPRPSALLLDIPEKKEKDKPKKKAKKKPKKKPKSGSEKCQATVSQRPASKVLERLFAAFPFSCTTQEESATANEATKATRRRSLPIKSKSRPVSLFSIGSVFSRVPETVYEEAIVTPTMADTMTLRPALVSARIQSNASNRTSVMSTRSMKSIMSSTVSEVANKPVASGSGVSCSIVLAEPNVFLTGFEHDGRSRRHSSNTTALLRGKLVLNVSKNVKIKSVMVKLTGHARTEWPEGIPPTKVETSEDESLRTQALSFFHAMHGTWNTPYGNQCSYTLKEDKSPQPPQNRRPLSMSMSPTPSMFSVPRGTTGPTAKELKRLSLQSVQARSFGKGESPILSPDQLKGYKIFRPGTYEYSFELPIDHHQLETTRLPYGSVKWELETHIERAGAFKSNLHGAKEVSIVRIPDQLSLEMSEPISISRQWEDQLHYDIVISGKSFPIGTKIPVAFKLTPLAKVQVHKLKVFVTESVEYWTNDRRVTRKDAGRRILLLEKTAGKPLDKQYEGSDITILSGGELTAEERHEARTAATRRRTLEAERSNAAAQPLPEATDNLLGDLDLGLETYWGSTEMELNVQIPTCEQMAKDKSMKLHPDCSWKNVNVFHWIKIVMRISRLDPDDPAKKRRRHFEISIDSPFTVLNCRATQANMSLPRYSGPEVPGFHQHASCGCSDAQILATDPSPASSTGTLAVAEADAVTPSALPTAPQAAHLQNPALGTNGGSRPGSVGMPPTSANPLQRVLDQEEFENPRPIHLLRVPSYDPPAFDADSSPPLPMDIMTPPPNYDAIIGTPSVDGLADYFTRLELFEGPQLEGVPEDDSDSDDANVPTRITSRTGRVHVANPRTPGGRLVPSRSLDLERPVMNLSMDGVASRPDVNVDGDAPGPNFI